MNRHKDRLIADLDREFTDTGRVPEVRADEPPPFVVNTPWHIDTGWDGAETAVVDAAGYLICDCEPTDDTEYPSEPHIAHRNARVIVEAVNASRKPILFAGLLTAEDVRSAFEDIHETPDWDWIARHLCDLAEQAHAERKVKGGAHAA